MVVASLGPFDKIFAEVDSVGAGLGAPQLSKTMFPDIGAESGIDTSKPIGFWMAPMKDAPDKFDIGFFVPITDPAKFESFLQKKLGFSAATEQGGVKNFTRPGPDGKLSGILLKLIGSTMFLVDSPETLPRLPRDPNALLGDLTTKYLAGVRVNFKDAPPASIAKLASEFSKGIQAAPEPGIDPALVSQAKDLQVKQYIQLFNELSGIVGGVRFDSSTRSIKAEWDATFRPNSELAKNVAAIKSSKSNFGGLVSIGNAFHFVQMSTLTPVDVELFKFNVQYIQKLVEQGQKSAPVATPEDVEAQKFAAQIATMVVDEIGASAKIDGGIAIRTEGKAFTVALGAGVGDGKKLAATLKEYAEKQKSNPEFPEVLFDFATHQNINLHFMKIPTPEVAQLRKMFGEEIDVAVGTGDKVAWLVVGDGALNELKRAIDESAVAASKPMEKNAQMKLDLKPILQYIGSYESQPGVLKTIGDTAGAFNGTPVIQMQQTATDQGVKGELTVSEDVFKIVRDAVAAAAASSLFGGAGS
jgi:hypothetical protein